MLLRVLWFFTFASLSAVGFSQSLDWLDTTEGGGDHVFYSTAIDHSTSEVYVIGSFKNDIQSSGGATIIADAASETSTVSSNGEEDLLFAKYSPQGDLIWSITGGSNKKDELLAVDVLPNGSILVGGYISRSASIETSEGVVVIPTTTSDDRLRAITLLFSSDGELLDYWLHDDAEKSAVIDIVVDAAGITTLYQVDSPEYTANGVTYSTNRQLFIERRDFDFSVSWLNGIGSSSNSMSWDFDETHARLTSFQGEVSVLSGFQNDLQYVTHYDNTGAYLYQNSYSLGADGSGLDYAITRFYSDGQIAWMNSILQSSNTLRGMDITANCEGIYMCATGAGVLLGLMTFPGLGLVYAPNQSVFVAKISTNSGLTEWVDVIESEEFSDTEGAYAITTDSNGNLYCGGFFEESLNVTDWNSVDSGNEGGFVLCYSSDGDFQWSESIEGDYEVVVYDLDIINDQLFVCGRGSDNMDGGNSSSDSNKNGFVANFTCPVLGTVTCCELYDSGPLTVQSVDDCININALFSYPNRPTNGLVLQYSADGLTFADVSPFGDNDQLSLTDAEEGFYRLFTNISGCGDFYSEVVEYSIPPTGNTHHPGAETCNLNYWLRADKLTSNAGVEFLNDEEGVLEAWTDLAEGYSAVSRDENHIEVEENQPFRLTDHFNGHPAVAFDGDDNLVIQEKAVFGNENGLHFWMILRADTNMYTKRTLLSVGNQVEGFGIDIDRDSVGVWTPDGDYFRAAHNHFNEPFLLEVVFDSVEGTSLIVDGRATIAHSSVPVSTLDESSVLFNELMNTEESDGGPFVLGMPSGAFDVSKGFIGEIAEVVSYQGVTSQENADRVRSYLALRYGLSLHHPPSQDYFGTNGNTLIGFTGPLEGLDNGVFGIGADETSYFYQEKSRSIEPSELLLIEKVEPGIVEGGFLIFGHNGGALRPTESYLGQDTLRMERFWGVYENVDLGTVRCSIPDTPNNPYTTLLLSNDSLFTSVFETVCLTASGGYKQAEFNAVHQTYFTFSTSSFGIEPVISDETCNGLSDGSIELIVTGAEPFHFQWEELGIEGEGVNVVDDLAAGSYSVHITDGNGCSTSYEFEISSPEALVISNTNLTDATCTNSDGGASFEVSGGTPTYLFSLTLDGDVPLEIYSDEAVGIAENIELTNLSIGSYTLVLTDQNACTQTIEFDIVSSDSTPPLIACFVSQERTVDASCVYVLEDFIGSAGITEACAIESTTQVPAAGTELSPGTHTVELTAEDGSGNVGTCSFELLVKDTTSPILTCVEDQVKGINSSCQYTLENFVPLVVGTDNCSEVAIIQTPSAGVSLTAGVYTISFMGIDAASNVVNCSFELTVADTTPPSLSCIGNQSREVDSNCSYILEDFTSSLSSSDNCSDVALVQSPAAGSELAIGDHNIEITSTDDSGNSTVCSFTLAIEDNSPPSITCPDAISRQVNTSCIYTLEDFTSDVVANDACGISSILQTPAPGTEIEVGNSIVSFVVEDSNGNSETCSFDLTVEDLTAPLINCLDDIEVNLDNSCVYVLPDFSTSLSINEACGILEINQSITAGTELTSGEYQVIIEVVDLSGNTTECTINIEVEDNTNPTFDCLSDQIEAVNSGCNHVLPDYTTAMNISDNCGIASIVQTPAPGTLMSQGNYNVSVSISDLSGNLVGCNFQVSIADETAPTIDCLSDITVWPNLDCTYELEDFASLVTANDNCSISGVDQSPAIGTPLTVGAHSIVLTVYDQAGNSATCSFDLTVEDTQDPVIECPDAVTKSLTSDCVYTMEDFLPTATVTDNCLIDEIVQLPSPGTLLGLGWHTVNLFATDVSGNTSSCAFQLFVQDIQEPQFDCFDDQLRPLGSDCTYVLESFVDGMAIDENCSVASVTQFPAPGTALSQGNHTISIQVIDNSGNSSACSFQLSVIDTDAPQITCVNELEYELTSCNFQLPQMVSQVLVEDECSDYSISQSIPQGTLLTVGAYSIEFTVADVFGNTTTCETTVNVVDTTTPEIECEDSYSVLPNDGCDYLVGNWTGIVDVSDNCSVTITSDLDGQMLSAGTYAVELTALDVNGNTSGCTSLLEVPVLEEPTIVCPTSVEITIDSDCTTLVPDASDYVFAAAACGNSSDLVFSQDLPAGIPFDADAPLTVSVEDEFGQVATCSTSLVRVDESAPVIECPEIVIVQLNPDCTVPALDLENLVVIDDCSLTSVQTNFEDLEIDGPGTHSLTYEVTDFYGLTSSCSSQISFQDVESPEMECLQDQTQPLTTDCNYVMPDFTGSVGTFDACGAVSLSQSPTAGFVFSSPQEINVILTAQDESGNTTSCSFVLTLVDEIAPVFTCLEDQEIEFEGCDFSLPSFTSGLSDDACGIITYTQVPPAGTELLPGIHTIEIIATDESMNMSSCSFELSVIKTDLLELNCAEPIELIGSECEIELPNYVDLVSYSGDCGDVILTQVPAPGTMITEGVSEITIFAIDAYSEVSCTFDLTYSINPIVNVVCPANIEVENAEGACGAIVNYQLPEVEVSCGTPELLLTGGLSPSSFFNLGETQVTFDIEINNEYHSSCQFTITVIDTEAPQLDCGEPIISCAPEVVFDAPLTNDNCGNVDLVRTDLTGLNSGDVFPLGTSTLTYLATDEAGNQSECSLTITVEEPPIPNFTEANIFVCAETEPIDLNAYLELVEGDKLWTGIGVNSTGVFNPSEVGTFEIEVEVTLGLCSNSDFITVVVGELPVVLAGDDFEVCGLQTELEGSGNASDWTWESDVNGIVLTGEESLTPQVESDFYGSVTYTVSGLSDEGCYASDQVQVVYFEPVSELNLGEDLLLLSNDAILIDCEFNGVGDLTWIWNETANLNQTEIDLGVIEVSGFEPGTYELVVKVENGPCPSKSDSLLISLDQVVIPTGFSPNGDNKNETFVIRGASQFDQIKFKVFSRNGMEVFATDDYKNDWDGTNSKGRTLPSDTYYIILELDHEVYQGYLVLRR